MKFETDKIIRVFSWLWVLTPNSITNPVKDKMIASIREMDR